MSARLPASVDAERMVAGRRSFQGVLRVADLPRVAAAVAKAPGEVAYGLDFGAGPLGDPELRVRLTGRLTLECQRTLELFEWPFQVDVRLGLLASEDEVAALPEQREPLLLEDGTLDPRRVIEDELLLAMPLVPVKPGSEMLQGEWSTPVGDAAAADEDAAARPFAGLRDLLDARAKGR